MLDDPPSPNQPRILASRAGGDDGASPEGLGVGAGEAFFDPPEDDDETSRHGRRRWRDRSRRRRSELVETDGLDDNEAKGAEPVDRAAPTAALDEGDSFGPAGTTALPPTVQPPTVQPATALPATAPTTTAPPLGRPQGRATAPRPVLLRLRRRRRRVLIGFTAFTAVCVALAGGATLYLRQRLAQIPRVEVPSLVEDEPGEVMNVLLVGSDSREGLEGAAARQAGKGKVLGQRSDTIMVLHVDPKRRQAAILSIPRDLYLPVVGGSGSDRVNAAFSVGGPERLIATISQGLGITVNHYIQVDFVGFKDIVDTVGGVEIYLPAWVRDFTSGLDLPMTGCVELDGDQGLAWVRSRNLESLVDGRWITDPRADLGRIQRQQDFIRRMLKKALSSGLTNPLQLNRLISIGVDDVTLDQDLSTRDITTLARRFDNLDADSVALLTLPTTPAQIGGASVLQLKTAEAQPLIDRINGVTPAAGSPVPGVDATTTTTAASPSTTLVGPSGVKVRVLNGTETKGAAARAGRDVTGAGFVVTGVGDAPALADRTTIRFRPERRARAELVEKSLLGPAVLVEDTTLSAANDVVLVVGKDYLGARIGALPPVPEPVTPTTSAGGTATTPTTLALPVPTTTSTPPTTVPSTLTPVLVPDGAPAPTC